LGFIGGFRLERHLLPGVLRLIRSGVKGSAGIPDSYAFSRSEHIDWRRGTGRVRWPYQAGCQRSYLWMVPLGR
jgi:hypothetical protein